LPACPGPQASSFFALCAFLTIGALALAFTTPRSPTLSGTARVVDGDTITISGTTIRLHGIDAPEASQACTRSTGTWACGIAAAAVLADLVRGKLVTCQLRGLDYYGRSLGVCFTGSRNINAMPASAASGFGRVPPRLPGTFAPLAAPRTDET
jgi:endonuclease YncB( thermonuclease family)